MQSDSTTEPLAIIGIGCRFPGNAGDPASFWKLLANGVDAISEVPPDRWSLSSYYHPDSSITGRTNSRWGGFVETIDHFDAQFFGISPREAARMDPQHRMLLEVAAEALDDAGQQWKQLAGTSTGVFVGISSQDFTVIQQGAGSTSIDSHSNTGAAMSIAANRLSYFFDLRGPSLSVDTACSSALVAIHFACKSIWQGECTQAIAGGCNVLIKPEPFIGFSRMSMLSPDGRCKAFDASANGFVRGEGAGMVMVKPLSQALADNDRIYALILASAVNQDGRTSSMTVPGCHAQEELVRVACKQAGISPTQIQYMEAHGTGTQVGDPIEAEALGKVLAPEREGVCILGSVKTNIGHLEPAAGVAGLIKVALALKHRQIPANLHFRTPNPQIPFDEYRLRVPLALESWPETEFAFAGVNSFGFGGTNAHVILRDAPAGAPAAVTCSNSTPDTRLIPFSARSPQALRELTQRLYEQLGEFGPAADATIDDICWTAAFRRNHFEHRLAIVAGSKAELLDQLRAFALNEERGGLAFGKQLPQPPRQVFVFSGQGPQWWAMGRQLLKSDPVFRATIERCDELLSSLATWSLMNELQADETNSRLGETAIAQPAIFAIQIALAARWKAWGIKPDAVVGHSVGEIAAAYIAGALSLEDAIQVIFHRGRCMDFASAHGRMLAVGLSAENVAVLLEGREKQVSIAAINTSSSVSLSGDAASLEAIATTLQKQGIFHRFLTVEYAFHSPQMDPIQDKLLASLPGIQPRSAILPLYSTVTGDVINGRELNAAYWWQNVRQPVRFASAIRHLVEEGFDTFLEISPHPVLTSAVLDVARETSAPITAVSSLKRHEDENRTLLQSLAVLYAIGSPVDWSAQSPSHGQLVDWPTYPWQRQRHWAESEDSLAYRVNDEVGPLLGHKVRSPFPAWDKTLDLRVQGFLVDHCVQGHVVLSATSYLEMGVSAARQVLGDGPISIENLEFSKACFPESEDPLHLQTVVRPEAGTFSIFSRPPGIQQAWTEHATGKFLSLDDHDQSGAKIDDIRARCPQELNAADCYERLRASGLEYGPAFQGIEKVWQGTREALARIVAPEALRAGLEGYHAHPAIIDACLQSLICALPVPDSDRISNPLYLPVEMRQVRLFAPVPNSLWCHVQVREHGARTVVAALSMYDDQGRRVMEINNLHCQAIGNTSTERLQDIVYQFEWQLKPLADAVPTQTSSLDLPCPSQLAIRSHDDALKLAKLGWVSKNNQLEPDLNQLCRVYLLDAFQNLGCPLQKGDRWTVSALATRLEILPRFERLLGRFLVMLAEDGVVKKLPGDHALNGHNKTEGTTDEPVWEVVHVDHNDPQVLWREMVARHTFAYPEFTMVGRCAGRFADVLRGQVDALELLFPEGSLNVAEHLYQDSLFLRFQNSLAQRTLANLVEDWPEGRTLRILEIGAGTGSLASYLLKVLPPKSTRYTFTDVANHFLLRAEEKLRDYPFVEYRLLDIESNPADQQFAQHSYDVILASGVLHATADLRQTLLNVRSLLADNGLLMLIETVRPLRWVDMVFGLTEGWWKFNDTALRPDHPLLSMQQWRALLPETGFCDVQEATGDPDLCHDHCLILARGESRAKTEAPIPESPLPEQSPGSWLIFADESGIATALETELQRHGATCLTVSPHDEYQFHDGHYRVNPAEPSQMHRLLHEVLKAHPDLRGMVHLWNCDLTPSDATPVSLDAALVQGTMSVVSLLQGLQMCDLPEWPRLWQVTRSAQAVWNPSEVTSPIQGAAWGLNRVLFTEHPRLRATVIDLSGSAQEKPCTDEIRSLCRELLANDIEEEVALRGGTRYVNRFARVTEQTQSALSTAMETPFRLETTRPGVLDQLCFRGIPSHPPGPGQVQIAVAATGLNFSDVMKALGLYPGLPDGPIPFGLECSGRITAVGENVTEWQPGDEVFAVAPFSFSGLVNTAAGLAVRKPQAMSFEEAATIPIAFLTAHYALNYLGRMTAGERVLIHSATGGVGLAAIQLARQAGAEIFATAGNNEKRDLLRALGVHHVMDSRSLNFADQILDITDGYGVDLVLNSLSGEAISKGLSVLADNGRFLEIGKRDIYQNRQLPLRPFQKNLSFIGIDLDRELRMRPEHVARLFQEACAGFDDSSLQPLFHRSFPVSNLIAAFRYMAQAKHIGKVVLTFEEQTVSVVPPDESTVSFRSDGTYLITGGLGGFGLELAHWLVKHGARHLVLMGRNGAVAGPALDTVQELRAAGAKVTVVAADVSQSNDVSRVLEDIRAMQIPLRGVFHAAMVLNDGLLRNMKLQQVKDVYGPKVQGAWNLHTLTKTDPLEYFVLFSSMSAVFGAGGQGNYAAANTMLDALAYFRKGQQLPAVSVSWGYLGETGFVARNPEVAERFNAIGVKSFTPAQALTLLGRFLANKTTHAAVFRLDWRQWRKTAPGADIPAKFEEMLKEVGDIPVESGTLTGAAVRQSLSSAAPAERREILQTYLREKVARILGTTTARIEVDRPLVELGLDSLMAVELGSTIEGELRLSLPSVELLRGPNLAQIADALLNQLTAPESVPAPTIVPIERDTSGEEEIRQSEALLAQIDSMSEEEIEALAKEFEEEDAS